MLNNFLFILPIIYLFFLVLSMLTATQEHKRKDWYNEESLFSGEKI